jgi:hypothetical protein
MLLKMGVRGCMYRDCARGFETNFFLLVSPDVAMIAMRAFEGKRGGEVGRGGWGGGGEREMSLRFRGACARWTKSDRRGVGYERWLVRVRSQMVGGNEQTEDGQEVGFRLRRRGG